MSCLKYDFVLNFFIENSLMVLVWEMARERG